MKSISQRHPRLYINVLHKTDNNEYRLEYYENQYNKNGHLQVESMLISNKFFLKSNSDNFFLFSLNKSEYQLLINLIKKQEKAIRIYSDKNKLDQLNVINSSLNLLIEYKKIFLKWFSENKI